MPTNPYPLGRVAEPAKTAAAANAYPVRSLAAYSASTSTYKYWWQSGVWLDQGNDGTCVGCTLSHRRADSPVPISGITYTYARKLYLDASGDSTYSKGTNAWYVCDELLQRGEISAYHWVTTPQELRNTILTVGPVAIGVTWFNSMFYPVAKYSNQYLKIDPTTGVAGGHEVLINGINLAPSSGKPFYRIKNSWGRSWANNGTVRAVATDLEDLIFNQDGDAVVVTEVAA